MTELFHENTERFLVVNYFPKKSQPLMFDRVLNKPLSAKLVTPET